MDFENGGLDRLQRELYSRNENAVPKEKRTPVEKEEESTVPTSWGDPKKTFELSYESMYKKNNTFFNKFLFGALAFFLVALGIASFIFLGGINMISSNNLSVKIVAPSSVSSGEEFDMGLTIINGNRTDLEGVAININYPDGSKSLVSGQVLSHDRVDIGSVASGGSTDYTVRTLLFGEKDAIKTFNIEIQYKVKGSNAVFSKQTTYDVSIGSSPLIISVDYPKEINSGQDIQLTIDVTSNSSVVVNNTLLKVEYPYGFTYKSSNIKPLRDNSVWSLGDLKNGDKKTLVILGTLVGQNLEDRSFRISAGMAPNNTKDFDVALVESLATIGIRKSFFDLEVSPINSNQAISSGQTFPVEIKWQNTLPDKIINSSIQATLSGSGFDRNNVVPSDSGFYRSLDNTIVWDKSGNNALAQFLPGDNGRVTFSLTSLQEAIVRGVKNPVINVHVVISGTRSGAENGPVSSTADLSMKISSNVVLTSKSYRFSGPFLNSGPIPPKADSESTYTITWVLTNTTNDLKDTVVSATLPVNVAWKSHSSPVSERVSFDPASRTVIWNVGNVASGAGFSNAPRQASFQVGITPGLNQVGTIPNLTSDAQLKTTDSFTGASMTSTGQSVTTFSSDAGLSSINGTVVK